MSLQGNDITLVAYLPELRPRERKSFEIVFREVRGMPFCHQMKTGVWEGRAVSVTEVNWLAVWMQGTRTVFLLSR